MALALDKAVQRCFADVGVATERQPRALAAGTGHRPADVRSVSMPRPLWADAGGTHRWIVDTTMHYLGPSSADTDAREPLKSLAEEEREKERNLDRTGVRAQLPADHTFVPAAMNTRGQAGGRLLQLISDLGDFGADHRLAGAGGLAKAALKSHLVGRFRARVACAAVRAATEAVCMRTQTVIEDRMRPGLDRGGERGAGAGGSSGASSGDGGSGSGSGSAGEEDVEGNAVLTVRELHMQPSMAE